MYVEVSVVTICDTATVLNWLPIYRNNAVVIGSRFTATTQCSQKSENNYRGLQYRIPIERISKLHHCESLKALVYNIYIYIYTEWPKKCMYIYIYTHTQTHTHTYNEHTCGSCGWCVRLSTRVTVTNVECLLTDDRQQMPRSLYS
jgi:hypothetical protein